MAGTFLILNPPPRQRHYLRLHPFSHARSLFKIDIHSEKSFFWAGKSNRSIKLTTTFAWLTSLFSHRIVIQRSSIGQSHVICGLGRRLRLPTPDSGSGLRRRFFPLRCSVTTCSRGRCLNYAILRIVLNCYVIYGLNGQSPLLLFYFLPINHHRPFPTSSLFLFSNPAPRSPRLTTPASRRV